MKKSLLFLLLLVIANVESTEAINTQVQQNQQGHFIIRFACPDWNDDVYIMVWDADNVYTNVWPGNRVYKVEGWYEYEVVAGSYVQFNDAGNQHPFLTSNNKYAWVYGWTQDIGPICKSECYVAYIDEKISLAAPQPCYFAALDENCDGEIEIGPENTTLVDKNEIINNYSTKFIRDGQIFIVRGEKVFTVTGQEVK